MLNLIITSKVKMKSLRFTQKNIFKTSVDTFYTLSFTFPRDVSDDDDDDNDDDKQSQLTSFVI